jgi:3-oxoacyl-[acyl-carrier-protein] synthase-1
MRKSRVYLNDLGIVCAVGWGKAEVAARLLAGDPSGLTVTDRFSPGLPIPVGLVERELPEPAGIRIEAASRNNRLLLAALQELRPRLAALRGRIDPGRLGVVVGTSTSGIAEGERAVRHLRREGRFPAGYHYGQQELGSPAAFLAEQVGAGGPAYTVSTACSSGAKALASAARLLRMGACDAVLAGAVDSLCRFTVGGFSALEAVSRERCNPFSLHRRGINIGEGAALFLVSREPGPVALLGVGESSDGYHMSAPDPAGTGVRLALRAALAEAAVTAGEIDYLNLHGTATPQNDAMEAAAVRDILGAELPASSTKPLTGHTLGAAGAVEAGICWLTASPHNPQGLLPPHRWDGVADPALPGLHLAAAGERADRLRLVMSNSFGFGGNNAVLVLGRE